MWDHSKKQYPMSLLHDKIINFNLQSVPFRPISISQMARLAIETQIRGISELIFRNMTLSIYFQGWKALSSLAAFLYSQQGQHLITKWEQLMLSQECQKCQNTEMFWKFWMAINEKKNMIFFKLGRSLTLQIFQLCNSVVLEIF